MTPASSNPQETFEEISNRLFTELSHLEKLWSEYEYLFGGPPERLALLKRKGHWFFASLQRLMVGELILALSRLTDPMTMSGRSNLVVESILADPLLAPNVRAELCCRIAEAREAAEPIRRHRNKAIAHLDAPTALDSASNPLPKLPRDLVRGLIDELQDVHSAHRAETLGSGVDYSITAVGSARSIVEALEYAETARMVEQSGARAKIEEIKKRGSEARARLESDS